MKKMIATAAVAALFTVGCGAAPEDMLGEGSELAAQGQPLDSTDGLLKGKWRSAAGNVIKFRLDGDGLMDTTVSPINYPVGSVIYDNSYFDCECNGIRQYKMSRRLWTAYPSPTWAPGSTLELNDAQGTLTETRYDGVKIQMFRIY